MLTVRRVLNNSVLLCTDEHGRECVATGRGIAFLIPVGGVVDPTRVHRLFLSTDRDGADRLARRIVSLPVEHIELATTLAEAAGTRFGADLVDRLIVPLADHLNSALWRAEAGITIDYPLEWETQAFYPAEVAFAREALDTIEQTTGTRLPDIEAIPISLHLVNAELGTESVMETLDLTGIVANCLTIVGEHFSFPINADAVAVARFATHVRHLIARHKAQVVHEDRLVQFLRPLADTQPDEHSCAQHMARILQDRLGNTLGEEEVLLLTLHVTRLVTDGQAIHPR
ncbi:MAG: PRD domain-containing protein [Propionibacteriaceae bacterium]|nr:PRD domain-containing protein [Propionibacteriaceae bacterium]